MKAGLLSCFVLALAPNVHGHRLDECLQATLVAVGTNRIDLSVDITPGVAASSKVLAVIDKDRDGKLSESERADYGKQVLSDIQLRLDERVLTPRLESALFPSLFEIQSGAGVIQIKATVLLGQLPAGTHTLTVTNTHLPAISVYLVNALAPKSHSVQIAKQTRDELQRSYRLDFEVIAAQK